MKGSTILGAVRRKSEFCACKNQPDLAAGWEHDYQRRITAMAMERVKSEFQTKTWDAFWRTAVQDESATDVGRVLSMSPGAVYVARSRVLARLKIEVKSMIADDEV